MSRSSQRSEKFEAICKTLLEEIQREELGEQNDSVLAARVRALREQLREELGSAERGVKSKGASERIQEMCRALLVEIGEDPDREGLLRTPERVSRMVADITIGYRQDLDKLLNNAIFHEDSSQMVIVKKIPFYSLCEHHLLPIHGHVHVAYLPRGKIIGLSKIPRIVHMFARRLQVQERMTSQIASTLDEVLSPVGVGCIVEAVHLCAMMRGVRTHSSSMVTSVMLGEFRENHMTRNEFLTMIGNSASFQGL